MTAPLYRSLEQQSGIVQSVTGIDELIAERDTLRAAFAAAVGFYDCPCGSGFEFGVDSTLEDYAALNRWLGAHVPCPVARVEALARELGWETGR